MKPWHSMARLACGASLVVLAGCAAKGQASLYLWETFPRQQYQALLRDNFSPAEQISLLEAQAEKARGAQAALPPGFRAHLGMLHLSVGNADRARELWQAEKATFPESSAYMDQLLKRLDPLAKPVKSENPA
jgi:hypothetical protein